MITPALTERRERYEFVSGADGKIGEANHLRNKPAPPRDVASVQRFVIQITGHSVPHILVNWPIEVEHIVSKNRAPRVHGGFAKRSTRSADPVTECLLPRIRDSDRAYPNIGRAAFEHEPSAFEHEPSAFEHEPSAFERGPILSLIHI